MLLAIAILQAAVGSQAIITGTFSIIKQCSSLRCFPKVKIVHTSSKIHGQIYTPEINWSLMILFCAVTFGFRDTERLRNAAEEAYVPENANTIKHLQATARKEVLPLFGLEKIWKILKIFQNRAATNHAAKEKQMEE